jgi:hypothetical protein
VAKTTEWADTTAAWGSEGGTVDGVTAHPDSGDVAA